MSVFRVQFDAMPWQDVEFLTGDGFDQWCRAGHIGYVLAGDLQIDVNGTVYSFEAGDGLFLPPGAETRHRGVAITPGTRLVMVEDVDSSSEAVPLTIGSTPPSSEEAETGSACARSDAASC